MVDFKKEAGPVFALLLICGLGKCTLGRLTSSRRSLLVKYVVQNCDSLSNFVLEEKANELGLCTVFIRYCFNA